MNLTRLYSLIGLLICLPACGHFHARAPSSTGGHSVPIFFPIFEGVGQFPAVPCTIGEIKGNCILDTGANMSQVSINYETNQFSILYKAKSVSAYGERIEDVVQVPKLVLGDSFAKKDFPAVRSNRYHNLPEYLAVVGADMLMGTDFIFHLGKGDDDPAQLILGLNAEEAASRNFKDFGSILPDKRFIAVKLSIGGTEVKAIWDTHVGWTAFSKKFIRMHPGLFKYMETQKNKDASGMEGVFRSYRLLKPVCITHNLCVSPTNNVMEHGIDLASEGVEPLDVILGNDLIWQFKWYFDFKNQRFAVQPR